MNKLKAIWGLFKKGEALERPGAWKNATIIYSLLSAVVYFLKTFGIIDLQIDDETLGKISVGGIAFANVIVHVISSKTVGLPNKTIPMHTGGNGKPGIDTRVQEPFNHDDIL